MIGFWIVAACRPPTEEVLLPDLPQGAWHGEVVIETVNGLEYQAQFPIAMRIDGEDWTILEQHLGQRASDDNGVWVGFSREDRLYESYEETVQTIYSLSATNHGLSGHYRQSIQFIPVEGPTVETIYEGRVTLTDLKPFLTDVPALELVGELALEPGTMGMNVRVRGGLAAIAAEYGGLQLIDVSDPSTPILIGESKPYGEKGSYNDVKWIDDQHLAVSSNWFGLIIYSVVDPYHPEVIAIWPGETPTRYDVHAIAIQGQHAFLATIGSVIDGDEVPGGLDVIDVSVPSTPSLLGSWSAAEIGGTIGHDLFPRGNTVWLCAWEAGLAALDTAEPEHIVHVGTYDDYFPRTSHSVWAFQQGKRELLLYGDENYAARLRVMDVSNSENPMVLSQWGTRPEVSIHNIMEADGFAYIAYYQDGVWVLDLNDPSEPVPIAQFSAWDFSASYAGKEFFDGVIGVDVVADHIYLTDTRRGLLVLKRNEE